jgi:FMN reductase (NADPH)
MSNPVIDTLMRHRSVRKFASEPIDEDTLHTLLCAGVRAASAGNLQHYSLIVVDDVEKQQALLGRQMFGAPLVVVAVVDEYRLKRWFELNDAPFYFDQSSNFLIGFWDAVIALHNIVIAAESMGLGGVYIGNVLSVDTAAILGTPEYVFPAGMVCLGHPGEAPDQRPRLPLEAVVHRNGYQIPSDDAMRANFREKDATWDTVPEARKEELRARGIGNFAQMRTLGHYTEAFIRGESEAILAHLAQAGFKLTDESD